MNKLLATLTAIVLLTSSAVMADEASPYDRIAASYTPFMDASDPLAFSMKVYSLSGSSYKFWRGSKDLYFDWCKTHAADWIADKDNWVTSHGDIHFGNIGSYPAGNFGELGFGLIDFDEVCRTPMQVEVMQGLITLRLTATHNDLELNDKKQRELCQILIDAYRESLTSGKSAGEILKDDANVKSLLRDAGKSYTKQELNKLATNGKFESVTYWKDGDLTGQVKDIYRPEMSHADDLAAGIEQAISHSAELRETFRFSKRDEIRAAIKDAVQRTRVGSSGSQGLKKYLILLEKPMKSKDHDLILYLKQEIPSSAERAGVSPKDTRSPGERVAVDFAALADPKPLMSSWCNLGAETYWVTFKEPWSDEFEPERFAGYSDLKAAARIWGIATGASHHRDPAAASLAAKLTPDQVELIRERSEAYVEQLKLDYLAFMRDPRTQAMRDKAIETVAAHGRK